MELVVPKSSPGGFVCCCVRHLRGSFPTTSTYSGDHSSNTLLTSGEKTQPTMIRSRGRSDVRLGCCWGQRQLGRVGRKFAEAGIKGKMPTPRIVLCIHIRKNEERAWRERRKPTENFSTTRPPCESVVAACVSEKKARCFREGRDGTAAAVATRTSRQQPDDEKSRHFVRGSRSSLQTEPIMRHGQRRARR